VLKKISDAQDSIVPAEHAAMKNNKGVSWRHAGLFSNVLRG
jgi:hypothetical protein